MKVSVVIPTYNEGEFIKKCLTSVVANNFVKEIIIVDDNSTDSTLKKVCEISNQCDQVDFNVIIKDKNDKGVAKSRNIGIEKAKCNYISFLDADDLYYPNRFNKDFKLFESSTNIDSTFNAIEYRILNQGEMALKNKILTSQKGTYSYSLFKLLIGKPRDNGGFFHINGLTIKKDIIDKVGYFPICDVGEDNIFKYSVALHSYSVTSNIDEPVGCYTRHGDNTWGKRMTRKKTKNQVNQLISFLRKNTNYIDKEDIYHLKKKIMLTQKSGDYNTLEKLKDLICVYLHLFMGFKSKESMPNN